MRGAGERTVEICVGPSAKPLRRLHEIRCHYLPRNELRGYGQASLRSGESEFALSARANRLESIQGCLFRKNQFSFSPQKSKSAVCPLLSAMDSLSYLLHLKMTKPQFRQ